jgi:hypothetical protein
MFGIQNAMLFAQWGVEDKAKAEGRKATQAEYAAAFAETIQRCIEAGTMHTLAQVKAAEVMRPNRGLFGWLCSYRHL